MHADLAEALRHGQLHGPMGRDLAVLVVPAVPVGKVDEERSGVPRFPLVAQDHGPAVARFGCRGGRAEGDGGATVGRAEPGGCLDRHARSLVPWGS